AFAGPTVLCLTVDPIMPYIRSRQEAGAANGTINRELSALRRMFRLGEQAGKVAHRPHIAMLREDNVRTGFFEPGQFRALVAHLPEDLKPVVTAAYLTGWRIASELLTRQWGHVDFIGGWLRLEPGEAKNREGRQFPLVPELRVVLDRQRVCTERMQKIRGQIIPWVFHRDGQRVRDFRGAWNSACRSAGLAGRLPHDLRRTAVRNMERAGV